MTEWHGGKGSTQRSVDRKKFNENWDKIFQKKKDDDSDDKKIKDEKGE